MADEAEEQPIEAPPSRGRHIAKRALRNKALSITFDERDLRNHVTGFHKRKKKRRKEARKQQEEAQRRKRIEERKKRRLERDIALYGGAPPAADSIVDGSDSEFSDDDKDSDTVPSVSGTTTYDNGELKVTVTTSEISREDEAFPIEKIGERARAQSVTTRKKHNVAATKKKPFKRVAKGKSRPKSHNRNDKKRTKKKGKKGR